MDYITIKTAGHLSDELRMWPGVTMCGEIKNGVALEHATQGIQETEGSWVIAYEDLMMLALAAFTARKEK